MSSVPGAHCAEGRDWHGILSGLASGGAMIDRVHLPAYQERTPGEYLWLFNCVSMHTRAMIPEETLVYPELENFPYSGFSKSAAFSRFQIESSMPLNCAGITINLFDFLGNGVIDKERYEPMLHNVKPFLERVRQTGVMENPLTGVRIMFDRNASYTLHTYGASSGFEQLYPCETIWAGLLGAFGVAFTYCDDITVRGEVIAVSGQYFRNLTRDQIQALLEKNNALIDGDAAATLFDMGCGDLIHIESLRWETQDNGVCAYEEDVSKYCSLGTIPARMTSQTLLGDALLIGYTANTSVRDITDFINPEKVRAGHGMTVVDERIMILPYGRYKRDIPVSLLNPERREIITRVLTEWETSVAAPVMVLGLAHTAVYAYHIQDELAVYIVNASLDPIDKGLHLYPGGMSRRKLIQSNNPEPCDPGDKGIRVYETTIAGEEPVEFRYSKGVMTLLLAFDPLECKLIHIRG